MRAARVPATAARPGASLTVSLGAMILLALAAPAGGLLAALGYPRAVQMLPMLGVQWLGALLVLRHLFRRTRPTPAYLISPRLRAVDLTLVPLLLLGLALVGAAGGAALGLRLPGGSAGALTAALTAALAAARPAGALDYALLAVAALSTGFCLELIFRGLFLPVLRQLVPAWLAALLSIACFSVLYLPGWGLAGVLTAAGWALPVTGYMLWRRQVVPAMLVHMLSLPLVVLVLLPRLTG